MTDTRASNEGAEPTAAQVAVRDALATYAERRVARYLTLRLPELIGKDLLMMTLRQPKDASELLLQAFLAWESSSEETHMGTTAQEIAIALSTGAIDLGDILFPKDGDLWVIEVKSQTNTLNSSSLVRTIQTLKRRVDDHSRPRATRARRVRAMIGVLRGPDRDEEVTYKAANHRDSDINGFAYRHMVGRPFWMWLTGHPGIYSLVGDTTALSDAIGAARTACIERLSKVLENWLATFGEARDAQTLLKLLEEGHRPT